MNTRRRFCSHLFVLLLLSLNNISAVVVSNSNSTSSSEKVKLDLYYETLCPYCSNFIVNYLPELYKTGLISAVDLRLFPFGNAKVSSTGSITCQHGPLECLLNTIEACAIDVWPELDKHFSFIYCVESLIFNERFSEWEICFDELHFDRTPIDKCYTSGYGNKLILKYAELTKALEPPHEYVPWVVVDGEPLHDDYEDFLSYICKAYKGSSPLNACDNLAIISKPYDKVKHAHQVSYREDLKTSSQVDAIEDNASVTL